MLFIVCFCFFSKESFDDLFGLQKMCDLKTQVSKPGGGYFGRDGQKNMQRGQKGDPTHSWAQVRCGCWSDPLTKKKSQVSPSMGTIGKISCNRGLKSLQRLCTGREL
jgi:hypothetical protein